MQVQHDTQLIEGLVSLKAQDLAPKPNQTLESYTLTQTTLGAIDRLTSSPMGNLIAAFITGSNQIFIIDTRGRTRRERFLLKSCDKKFSRQSFTSKGIDFSPDGTRLAIGQTDCIIYIYKLSQNTSSGDQSVDQSHLKPTITGKFVCSSPITCLIWTELGVLFGTQDGKVKLISMSIKVAPDGGQSSSFATSAKVNSIHSPQSKGASPIALAFKSPVIAVGFVDGNVLLLAPNEIDTSGGEQSLGSLAPAAEQSSTIRRNSSQQPSSIVQSIVHTCPPSHLAFLTTNVICCAGSDGKIAFHSTNNYLNHHKSDNKQSLEGSLLQTIDMKEDLVSLDYSPINEVLAIVSSSKLSFIKYNQESSSWQLQAAHIELANALSLTSVLWTRDGSQLIVGTLTGSLELFRCQWSKQTVGDQLDICHIAKNRVRITDRARNLLATYRTQHDIKKVNLLDNGQSVIIWTTNSLLLARLGHFQQSEIPWARADRSVKFCFDHPGFVLIFKSSDRQLLLVKLGQDQIIYTVKMDTIRRSTISVRQYQSVKLIGGSCSSSMTPMAPDDKLTPSSARSRHSSFAAPAPLPTDSGNDSSLQLLQASTFDTIVGHRSTTESLNERLAYIMDSNQLIVVDMKTNLRELTLTHGEPIVWLEFSLTSNNLVFRDKLNRLHLLRLEHGPAEKGKSKVLVENCAFADWLPESDILIAQSVHEIFVWYNLDEPNRTTMLDSRAYNLTRAPPVIDLSLAAKNQHGKPYLTVARISSDYQLVLSNGTRIALDRTKVKFYTEIVCQRKLASALDILEKEAAVAKTEAGSSNSNLDLWSRLGWLAIDRADLQVAIKAFGWLGHSRMVQYLERCLAKPEELDWRLALLRGDWETFEQVADSQQVVLTYKRLNKWTRLIEYLNKTQQFRQRDLAEAEFRQWLLDKGRYLEGAKIQAKNGDLLGAVELLVANKRFAEAAELFIAEERVSLARAHDRSTNLDAALMELARRLCSNLVDLGEFHRAGTLCEKILNKPNEALDLYVRGESYERATDLAKLVDPNQLDQIEESHGDHLMKQFRADKRSRRQTYEAIEKFLASGKLVKALNSAVELRQFTKAYEILLTVRSKLELANDDGDDSSRELRQSLKTNSRPIAEHLFHDKGTGDNESKAVATLLIGEHFQEVVRFYMDQGDFEKAFEISLTHLNGRDQAKTVEQFVKLAQQKAESGELEPAERLYLMLDKAELAIEMHKGAKNYDRMLDLIGEFSPDSLESTLLLLARELESAGQYEAAEKYLLRASQAEWTNVVRMYQLASKWDEAYRVARANCASERDPLLIQMAYHWAKSLNSPQKAHELLKLKLNSLNFVVEFCCQNKNFPFALELCKCDPSETGKLSELVRRYAAHLESEHKFDRAEAILVQFNLVEEAAKMYLDNDQHLEAIRVVESRLGYSSTSDESDNAAAAAANNDNNRSATNGKQHGQLVELLNRILVQCADRLVAGLTIKQQLISGQVSGEDGERLLAAQQMYLRARRPELAVNLYKERGLWKEAIQVAQRFAPQLLESLEGELDAEVGGDVGPIVARIGEERGLVKDKTGGGQVSQTNTSDNGGVTIGPDYLRSQAEVSMKNGDMNGTRTALGKFLESLIEGDT